MDYLAVDTETTGLSYFDKPFCVSYAYREGEEVISGVIKVAEFDNIRQLLKSADRYIFHNAKFDLRMLEHAALLNPGEYTWDQIYDTECLSHLFNEQNGKALKRLAKELLGLETDEAEVLRAARRKLGLKKVDGYDALPPEVLEPYAIKDAEFTLAVFEELWPHVYCEPELLKVFREEQELTGVLFEMEQAGIGVDLDYVKEEAHKLAGEILEGDLRLRDIVKNEEFNPNSHQQVMAAFEARGIKIPNTQKATLVELDDELAKTLLRLRHATKLYSSYFRPILAEQRGGVLHPNFKQWGTRGRRFSAGATEDG